MANLPVVLLAMPIELSALRREAQSAVRVTRRPAAWRLRVGGTDAYAVVTGQGRERAEQTSRWAIRELAPAAMIAAGIAGGTLPRQRPGDVVVLEAADRADADGLSGSSAAADAALAAQLQEAMRRPGGGCDRGRGVTVDSVASAPDKRGLGQLGAVSVDMESYWVMSAAAAAGVPAVGLRVVADPVDLTVPRSMLALSGLQDGRWWLEIGALWRMPLESAQILRTWRDTQTALRALAVALRRALPAVAAAREPDEPCGRGGTQERAGDG